MKGGDGEKFILQIVQADILIPVTCLKGKGDDWWPLHHYIFIFI